MVAPTKYVQAFSFAGYQTTNPTRPLPGVRVDIELQNLQTTTTQTINALADVRRDDGKLKNGIVTPESLAPGMAYGVLPPVPWSTGVLYTPPQAVWQGNKLYQCIQQHVSTTFASDLAAGFWNLVLDFQPPIDAANAAATAAQNSANAAAASATTATNAATSATASKNAAATSAANAATSEANALTSKNAAAASATAAANSATSADADADRAEAALAAMMPDAAHDGKTYGRKDGAWSEALAISAYTDAAVLAKVKNVDGTGSGLDADLLDGLNSNFFAPINNPAFTGIPTAPTPATGDNSTTLATTAYVKANDAVLAPINNPAFTGTPTAPVAAPGTNSAQIATTSFVAASYAPLASPAFTGSPTAPTATPGDSTTKLATTAFVTNAITAAGGVLPSNANPIMDGVAAPGSSALYARGDHVHPSDTSRVAKSGDTMTGPLNIVQAASAAGLGLDVRPTAGEARARVKSADNYAEIILDKGTGANLFSRILGQRGGVVRWQLLMPDTAAEGGANSGSDATLGAYSDAGAFLGNALAFNRATQLGQVKGDPTAALGIATKQYVDAQEVAHSPIGSILIWSGATPPTNYIKANGALLNRVGTYAALFAWAAGSSGNWITEADWTTNFKYGSYSNGDGVNTFRVPDLRGEFIRFLDDSKGTTDAGRVLGTWQDGQFLSHNHAGSTYADHYHGVQSAVTYSSGPSGMNATGVSNAQRTSPARYSGPVEGSLNVNVVANGGAETRSRNVALNVCIKYQ